MPRENYVGHVYRLVCTNYRFRLLVPKSNTPTNEYTLNKGTSCLMMNAQ